MDGVAQFFTIVAQFGGRVAIGAKFDGRGYSLFANSQ